MKKIFTVTGPSCSGKSTLVNELVKTGAFAKVVTTTSRARRDGEIPGVDYYFRQKGEMAEMLAEGLFIEQVEYKGCLYGTEFSEIDRIFKNQQTPIIIVDPRGVNALKKEMDCYTIYVDGLIKDLMSRFLIRFRDNPLANPDYEADRLIEIQKEHQSWWLDMNYNYSIPSFTKDSQDAIIKRLVNQATLFKGTYKSND